MYFGIKSCAYVAHDYLNVFKHLVLWLCAVEVELQGVPPHVFDDLHQAVEHLRLQLADQGAQRRARSRDGHRSRIGGWLRQVRCFCQRLRYATKTWQSHLTACARETTPIFYAGVTMRGPGDAAVLCLSDIMSNCSIDF